MMSLRISKSGYPVASAHAQNRFRYSSRATQPPVPPQRQLIHPMASISLLTSASLPADFWSESLDTLARYLDLQPNFLGLTAIFEARTLPSRKEDAIPRVPRKQRASELPLPHNAATNYRLANYRWQKGSVGVVDQGRRRSPLASR